MNKDLIVVRQLPIIEDQLRAVKGKVEERVALALSMPCTEETKADVKKARTELSKEFADLERRRKEVKAAIMGPYTAFEVVYKECVADIYKLADLTLKARIDEVDKELRKKKEDAVRCYFDEYRQSLGIEEDLVSYEDAGIKVTLSASEKALKADAKAFLDHIDADLRAIDAMPNWDELLVEYRHTYDLPRSLAVVAERTKAREVEAARRAKTVEQQAAVERAVEKVDAVLPAPTPEPMAEQEAPLAPPTAAPSPEPEQAEKVYSTSFRVTGTIAQLTALKTFLTDGGYEYEQL